MVLADRVAEDFRIEGLAEALAAPGTDMRIFGKPSTRDRRRMAVALATGTTIEEARARAVEAAGRMRIVYG